MTETRRFHRGDLVEYHGERWTVYTGEDACGAVDLCRTENDARPLGDRVAGVSASVLRLVASAPDRTLGKGADIDYIKREDRNRRAADEHRAGPADMTPDCLPRILTETPEEHDAHLARLRAAMAGETPLGHLSETPRHDGITWIAEGPRGRLWVIIWQPARTEDNMRAWQHPRGKTKHWGHAASVEEARREAARIAGLIEDGKG